MTKVKDSSERKSKGGRPRLSETTRDIIVQLYNADYKIADIETACHVSRDTIYRILRERRAEQNGEV